MTVQCYNRFFCIRPCKTVAPKISQWKQDQECPSHTPSRASTILWVTWSVTIFFPSSSNSSKKTVVQWSSKEKFLLFEVKAHLTTGYQDNLPAKMCFNLSEHWRLIKSNPSWSFVADVFLGWIPNLSHQSHAAHSSSEKTYTPASAHSSNR